MLGPDAPGDYIVGGEYGSSLRGSDREQFLSSIPNQTTTTFGMGHVLHRDAADCWVTQVADFANLVT